MSRKRTKNPTKPDVSVKMPDLQDRSEVSRGAKWMLRVLLVVAVVAVYARVCGFDFVLFDDKQYVYENRHVKQGLTVANVLWALTTGTTANWHPLTWFSYFVDYELFGLHAGGYHAINLIFHVLNTLFLFEALLLLTRRVNGSVWACACVAALFGLHPLHVESVAWVAERKDVLSAFFWTLALWGYGRYVQRPCSARYAIVFVSFALGLMAKPMLVTLPFVLLLLDYWPLQRLPEDTGRMLPARLLVEKIPLFVLSAASCAVTLIAQQSGGAISSFARLPLWVRIGNAAEAYVGYLWKAIWPTSLAVFYPYPITYGNESRYAAALVLLAILSLVLLWGFRKKRYAAVGWLWYLGTLVPAIGIVQVGAQSMADRYTYIPLTGVFIVVAFAGTDLVRYWRISWKIPVAAALFVLGALAIASAIQVQHWRNGVTLFTHALEVTKDNALSRTQLGIALLEEGQTEAAIPHLEAVVRLSPLLAPGHLNLADAYAKAGRAEEAIAEFQKVLGMPPCGVTTRAYSGLGMLLNNMGRKEEAVQYLLKAVDNEEEQATIQVLVGNAKLAEGDLEAAARHISRAIEIDPADPVAQFSMGRLRAAKGDSAGAVQSFQNSLAKKGDDWEVHFSLAEELAKLGRVTEAIRSYQEAIRLRPDSASALMNLGNLLALQNRADEALVLYNKAIALEPNNAQVQYNRANVLEMQGNLAEAETGYRKAFEMNPAYAEAANNLAGVLVKLGRTEEAVACYKKVIELRPRQVNAYINLAAVCVRSGDSETAIQYLREALGIEPGNQVARQRLERIEKTSPGAGTVLAP